MVGRDRAFAKEDLSVLATYAACLRFGRAGTRVGLLLPQGLFQSRKNAKGFRRFRLGDSGIHLRVDGVTDFSAYAAFGDAKNRTAALFCTLGGEPATYPVRYRRFAPGGAFEVLRAMPSAPDDPTSNWALYAEDEAAAPAAVSVRTYRARTGVFTGGANAVFYLRVLDGEGPLLRVENDTDRAKVKVERVEAQLEPEWLYPFAKGRDLGPWTVDRPGNAIVVPHTVETKMRPVPPEALGGTAPARSPTSPATRPCCACARASPAWTRPASPRASTRCCGWATTPSRRTRWPGSTSRAPSAVRWSARLPWPGRCGPPCCRRS